MRLAVVEDDRAFCARVADAIRSAGHDCFEFHSGDALRRSLRRESYDLLVVDEAIGDVPPTELIRWMHASMPWTPPVILLTAPRGHDTPRLPEADARLARREAVDGIAGEVEGVLRRRFDGKVDFGSHVFDREHRAVTMGDTAVVLTHKEFALAWLLFQNPGRPLSRAHVMEAVWGRQLDRGSRTLDAHVSQVRNRLGLGGDGPLELRSIYGFGYRLGAVGGG